MSSFSFFANNFQLETDLTLDSLSLTVLEKAFLEVQKQLESFANNPEFNQKLAIAFGENFDANTTANLAQAWQTGDFSFLPTFQVLTASELNGANGAFASSTNRIYLSDSVIVSNREATSPDFLVNLLLEEIGHKVDSLINSSDSIGDEGAIFAKLVQLKGQETLSPQTLQALKVEDDSGVINLNGQVIAVENQNFIGTNGNDTLTGGIEDDYFLPKIGADSITGGAGYDFLEIDNSGDSVATTITYTSSNNGTITGGSNNGTTFKEIEKLDLQTGSGNDNINVTALDNLVLDTGGGNDTVIGSATGINEIKAKAGTDSLQGGNNDDILEGGTGNDTLNGGSGNDELIGVDSNSLTPGSAEIDYLYGGSGADVFVLRSNGLVHYDDKNTTSNGSGNYAYIDFNSAEDTIKLEGSVNNYLLQVVGTNTNLYFDKLGSEPDELIAVLASTGFNLNSPAFDYTIELPHISLNVLPSSVAEDGIANLVYTFTRGGNTTTALTVNYNVAGTATFNTDYTQTGAASFTATNGSITFAAGASTATLTIDPTTDILIENNETVILTLATGIDYLLETITPVTGTILNDDTPPTITLGVSPISVAEDGIPNLVYTFTRSGNTASALTINYSVAGTATLNTDYTQTGAASFTATNGTITFAAGASTASLTVDPTPDILIENNETIALTLATGTGYNIGTTTVVTGTILNDDNPPSITLAVSPSSVAEDGTNNLVYTFTRTESTVSPLTVSYSIAGTATLNTDYTQTGAASFSETTGTIIFPAGSSTATLTVDPTADTIVESSETVALTLTTGTGGYTIGTTTAVTGTINNDDSRAIPLDVVFLQDLSGSFGDDIATVQTLVPSLVSSLRNFEPNTNFGLTTFVDKPISPFGEAASGDYVYKTDLGVTNSETSLQTTYNNLNIYYGMDEPEAQLEALLQVALRPTEVGFRSGTQRIAVLFTDATYHVAGDGAVSGIITPNNGDNILNGTPAGTGEDYPAVAQLASALQAANILPVFAVTADVMPSYQNLITQLGGIGSVVQLSSDSSNIINAIISGLSQVVNVSVTPTSGLVTTELGGTASFTVALTSQPSANVTIGLSVSDTTEGSISLSSLTFTSSNFNTPQTVTVTGVDDSILDGDIAYTVITAPVVSNDPNYNGLNPADVSVTNLDNEDDDSTITLAVAPSSVAEDGITNLVYTFTRSGSTTDDLIVNYSVAGTATLNTDYTQTGASSFTATSGTITFAVGASTATLTIDPTQDATVETDETVALSLTTGIGYIIGTTTAVTGTITNDDTAIGILITGTSGNDNLVGGTGNDTLLGLAGNDTLNGGLGADSLEGGIGNDTYSVDNPGDLVVEVASAGTDLVNATITYTLTANVENLTLTGTDNINGTGNTLANKITGNTGNNILTGDAGNDTLDGSSGNDTLNGDAGNDSLIGGIGADSLTGGDGSDIYSVDDVGDVVAETNSVLATGGTDLVNATINYTLGANVEKLTLTGTANINGTGNTLANTITGNTGNNILTGDVGNDTLDGSSGNDTLNGDAGNDSLIGGIGVDSLTGGDGNDTYSVDNVGDVVIETNSVLATGGTDLVNSTITYTLGTNVENLTLTGTTAINGTGNTLNNKITGNTGNNILIGDAGNDTLNGGVGNDTLNGDAGNDSLVGGAGVDSLTGGDGNDTYSVDDVGDVVIETNSVLATGGTDLVNSTIAYTLGANVENLTLTGTTAINGTGNTLANKIMGNTGANTLTGDVGNDTLLGGNGNDNLVGGNGADSLTGGAGLDSFGFNSPLEGIDRITDFTVVDDTIQVSLAGFSGGLIAGAVITATQFTLGATATTSAHRFGYESSTGKLWFDSDGSGATAAVQFATLNTGLALTNADIFVLA